MTTILDQLPQLWLTLIKRLDAKYAKLCPTDWAPFGFTSTTAS